MVNHSIDVMGKQELAKERYIGNINNQQEIKYSQDALYVLNGKWCMPVIIAIFMDIIGIEKQHQKVISGE